jgi:hypothetical protein
MRRTLVFIVTAVLWSPQIYAGLSQDETTVNTDFTTLNCKDHQVTDLGTYRLHVLHREDGSTINEYVTSAGKIFAVSWNGGRRHPNLSSLLGLNYEEYKAANPLVPSHARGAGAKGRYGNGKRSVETANIVVETGGHLGHVQGRAWVAKLIPQGLTTSDIK